MGDSATPGAQAAPPRTAPSDEAVLAAARERLDAPTPPGLAKLLAHLQEKNHWSLSEKRLKRLLTEAGLRGGGGSGSSVPASRIDDTLPLPDSVRATYFDAVKGRGLLAARPLREGETLFVEDAFVAAPPPQAVKALLQGEICNHCFLPVASRMLAVGCRHAGACRARFCSRLCQERAMHTQHAVLCPGVNRAAQPLLDLVQEHAWQSLHLAARATARALLTRSRTPPPSITRETGASIQGLGRAEAPASLEETMHHLHSFATVSELDRRARSPGWNAEREQFTALAREAHARFTAALNPRHAERPAGFPVAHDALSAQETDALFSWTAFLGMIGRANLNMESHGGMCTYGDGPRSLTGRPGAQPAQPRMHAQRAHQPRARPLGRAPRDADHRDGGARCGQGRGTTDQLRGPRPGSRGAAKDALARLLLWPVRLRQV